MRRCGMLQRSAQRVPVQVDRRFRFPFDPSASLSGKAICRYWGDSPNRTEHPAFQRVSSANPRR